MKGEGRINGEMRSFWGVEAWEGSRHESVVEYYYRSRVDPAVCHSEIAR